MIDSPAGTSQLPRSRLVPAAVPGLQITFRGLDPSEEVVYFVRRCAARLGDAERLEVTVALQSDCHRVQLRDSVSGASLVESEEDVFLAVRNAFDRWQVDSGVPPQPM